MKQKERRRIQKKEIILEKESRRIKKKERILKIIRNNKNILLLNVTTSVYETLSIAINRNTPFSTVKHTFRFRGNSIV